MSTPQTLHVSEPSSMNCVVCKHPAIPRSPYCPRCRLLVVGVRGGGQLRLELRRSYGPPY